MERILGGIERRIGNLASKGDLSTVNMTKTLVDPRARRDDPFESLRKNSSVKGIAGKRREGGKNAKALPEVTASRISR